MMPSARRWRGLPPRRPDRASGILHSSAAVAVALVSTRLAAPACLHANQADAAAAVAAGPDDEAEAGGWTAAPVGPAVIAFAVATPRGSYRRCTLRSSMHLHYR